MESRLIYSAIEAVKNKIRWEKQDESEWIFMGVGKMVNKTLVFERIKTTFGEEQIFIQLGRENSVVINYENLDTIFNVFDEIDFILSNRKFSLFMEFNKIGVFRIGSL